MMQYAKKRTRRDLIKTNADGCRAHLAPVYRRYPEQHSPQMAFLELDPIGLTLTALYNPTVGNAEPDKVFHVQVLWFGISPFLRGEVIAKMLEDADVLACSEQIIAGYASTLLPGGRITGILTDDAFEATVELQRLLDAYSNTPDALIAVKDVSEFLPSPDHAGITSSTAYEEIQAATVRLRAKAASEGILLKGDLFARLAHLLWVAHEASPADRGG